MLKFSDGMVKFIKLNPYRQKFAIVIHIDTHKNVKMGAEKNIKFFVKLFYVFLFKKKA